jgi:hypothetical protein
MWRAARLVGAPGETQVPGDNSVDLFTNDLGVVVICDAAGNLQGANIYAGGGMGRTHRNNDTAAMLVREPRRPHPSSRSFSCARMCRLQYGG